ncbi:MAG: GDP-mannose:cellobiosyl-diphosphopolyprenol alpha-mannosyltransferase [Candidatus Scalindua rubra]|uniref:GDP-mannose:cellobiosyl-diphosphopolyprenol alpha-mannosyltransferase n=1 Tax=Candidatus Scalindua rubra TaxID=1872076 RepID=A0A1E3X975_9BACT|nr:MAG: GDP-mannose:cellobiosyl-diphosphopolyprenol alpha-mannosyltransferase [Candidatus Scalindua rubra]
MENKLIEGETLFADGKIEEAEECFLSIVENDSNNKEAYNNLGVIAFQKDDTERAIDYFTRSLEIDPLYRDAIVNYTNLLRTLNQLHIAVPLLEKIAEINPSDKDIIQLLEDIRSIPRSRFKIAFICYPGLESFLGDIVNFLKTKYEVRTCYTKNKQEIESTVEWADVIWLEWANELTATLTNTVAILENKHVICRLHSYEAFTPNIHQVKWKKIDHVIFVAPHIQKIVLNQVKGLNPESTSVVPNAVDLKKFTFTQRKPGYNLAYMGHVNYKKGPMLLLHAFLELYRINNKYRLFLIGDFQEVRYKLYFNQMIREMGLERNIQIEDWTDDIGNWLNDKQYIICTSVLEGHPVGIMEAMACGLKPLIHNYVGARKSYPDKYIWNTIPEFINMVTDDNYDSTEYRKFIETNYSLDMQLKKIDKIFSKSESSLLSSAMVTTT